MRGFNLHFVRGVKLSILFEDKCLLHVSSRFISFSFVLCVTSIYFKAVYWVVWFLLPYTFQALLVFSKQDRRHQPCLLFVLFRSVWCSEYLYRYFSWNIFCRKYAPLPNIIYTIANRGIWGNKSKRNGAKRYAAQPQSERANAHLTGLLRAAPSVFSSQNCSPSMPPFTLPLLATIALAWKVSLLAETASLATTAIRHAACNLLSHHDAHRAFVLRLWTCFKTEALYFVRLLVLKSS